MIKDNRFWLRLYDKFSSSYLKTDYSNPADADVRANLKSLIYNLCISTQQVAMLQTE